MNKALGEVPVTIKLRTGVKDGRNTVHKLMPRIASEWGVGCMTVSNICYLTIQHEPLARGGVIGVLGLPAEPRVHLTIDAWVDLTFLSFVTGSVARTHATAEVSETRRLGLHQGMCYRRTREGRRLRL